MRIGLDDLDARIAEAFSEYARARLVAKDMNEAERRVSSLLAKSSVMPKWTPLGLVGVAFASLMGTIPFANAHPGVFLSGLTVSFASSIGLTWLMAHKSDPVPKLRTCITSEEMHAIFPSLNLSQAERVYCDTILLLADAASSTEEQALRDILPLLNAMLSSSRQLEAQRYSVLVAIGANTAGQLEAERETLVRQLEQADDSLVRQDLQRGLQMCETRLQNARALELGIKRLDAQQMVVLQTLSSVQSSLARQTIAQFPLAGPALEEIQQTVGQLNTQTYSVEQAVQEVMTGRAQ